MRRQTEGERSLFPRAFDSRVLFGACRVSVDRQDTDKTGYSVE